MAAVINFTRAFESAWARMMVILFQPFDAVKWFVIGFSAFLAGLIAGGNGFSFNTNFNTNNFKPGQFQLNTRSTGGTQQLQQFNDQVHHFFTSWSFGVIIGVIALGFFLIVGVSLLLFWLGARGQFLFLDNIVRNRGAISWPWQNYARAANDFFLFYVLLRIVVLLVILPLLVVAVIICIPLFREQRWPQGIEITELVAVGLVYFVVCLILEVLLFLFREFGVPLMFRQGILARAAFSETLKLIAREPGNITVFILLRFALLIGTVVCSLILFCITCLACCLSSWPYIGTLMLLPVLVFVRCFSLDCLAQFGPQYNVFTVDLPPSTEPQPPATT